VPGLVFLTRRDQRLHLRKLSWLEQCSPGGVRKYITARSNALQTAFERLLGPRAKERFREPDDGSGPDSKCRTFVLATNLESINSTTMVASYVRGRQDTYTILELHKLVVDVRIDRFFQMLSI
jgi:hypothetical protein